MLYIMNQTSFLKMFSYIITKGVELWSILEGLLGPHTRSNMSTSLEMVDPSAETIDMLIKYIEYVSIFLNNKNTFYLFDVA